MSAISSAHAFAYNPLWVVSDCNPEYLTASSTLFKYAIGTGASLINEPFPLLNWFPF